MDKLEFLPMQWVPYEVIHSTDLRKNQIHSLYYTGLCEPNDGIEYTFVPTTVMCEYENEIKRLYKDIEVTDHKISLCNEVFYTSKIEGANTTIIRTQQIHDGEYLDESNLFSEYMVLGMFKATKYMNLMCNRVSSSILRKCWEILTYGCRDNKSIEGTQYRTGDVQVGNHVGLNPVLLDEMMDSWIAYYNGDELKDYPFIKAALLHYTFEHIHPFCDGNGRFGRLLMSNFLVGNGYDKLKAVSFSKSIDKERSTYDTAFRLSENAYSDCTFFIEYMLGAMLDAIKDCLSTK